MEKINWPEEDERYWVALNAAPGVGPATFFKLLDGTGTAEAAWRATENELVRTEAMRPEALKGFIEFREKYDIDAELDRADEHETIIIIYHDDMYPASLRYISDPPPVLYVNGELTEEDEFAIAMVGSRKATNYGLRAARDIAGKLAARRVTVVSGLAFGIDAECHRGALDAGGRTVAVLGCGLDVDYPRHRDNLKQLIIGNGAVITEFPFGVTPDRRNFPRRNRIISGMTRGTVVVEAGEHSGALLTADYALEQGKEVFAVPGSIYSSMTKGTHQLIRQGATLVEDEMDILFELGWESEENVNLSVAEEELPLIAGREKIIWETLSQEPAHLDEIVRETGLPTPEVSAALILMEMKGLVIQEAGNRFVRQKER